MMKSKIDKEKHNLDNYVEWRMKKKMFFFSVYVT